MFIRIVLAAAFAALSVPSIAIAADALALKILGFSPDGRYFAFQQYGPQWDASRIYAEVFVIDASQDRFVAGVPLRVGVDMKDDTTEDNFGPQFKAFEATVRKRAASLISTHKIAKPGVVLASATDARAGEYSSGSDMPAAGAGLATLSAKHPALGDLNFKLETRTADWPKTSRLGTHKTATSCAQEMDPEKGVVFRLTLERGGHSIVLHDDKTIPASRHCVSGYGIVEIHAFDRPDGKVTLAAILGMHTRGFEGSDRVFLAVTRVLER